MNPTRYLPFPQTSPAERRWLFAIVAVALVLRLGMFWLGPAGDIRRAMYPDSTRYVELGRVLAQSGNFADKDETGGVIHPLLARLRDKRGQLEPLIAEGLRPEILRTPGYPLLIAAFFRLGLSLAALLILQCVLGAACVVLIWAIGRQLLTSRDVPLVAAAIVAIHPIEWITANSILAEEFFTFAMLAGIYVGVAWRNQGVMRAGIGGVFLGLSVLIRPVSILLGPVLAAWMLFMNRRKGFGAAVVLLACSLLPAAGWMVRNDMQGAGFRLTSVSSINNYSYTAAYMRIYREGGDTVRDRPAAVTALMAELDSRLGPHDNVLDGMDRLTREKILRDPWAYAMVFGRGMFKFVTDHSMPSFYGEMGWDYTPSGLYDRLWRRQATPGESSRLALAGALAWSVLNLALGIFCARGLFLLVRSREWAAALLLGGVLGYFLLVTQAVGMERFRQPALGFEALAAAVALTALARRLAAIRTAIPRREITPSPALQS